MGKHQYLTRDFIVSQAITMADQCGIDALSMRKLAAGMNIQAMSLYHHFKTKDELLSCMADKLIGSMELPDPEDSGQDWRMVLLMRAGSARELFSRHPWLPQVIDFQIHSGAKRLEYLDSYIGTLRKAGLPIGIAIRAISLIDSYIYGYCRQLAHASQSEMTPEQLAERFVGGFDATRYPFLSEAAALVMENGQDPDADFAAGLQIILSGVGLELQRS